MKIAILKQLILKRLYNALALSLLKFRGGHVLKRKSSSILGPSLFQTCRLCRYPKRTSSPSDNEVKNLKLCPFTYTDHNLNASLKCQEAKLVE